MILKKIYEELVLIRKELQSINNTKKLNVETITHQIQESLKEQILERPD